MNTRQKKAEPNFQRHIFLLQRLYEGREILFSKKSNFATSLTNGGLSKDEEWERVRKECVANGMTELSNKSWKHLRDITWQNFRRRAVAKLDQIKSKAKDVEELTECDRLALAIINNVTSPPQLQQSAPDYETEEVVEPTPPVEQPPTSLPLPQRSQRTATVTAFETTPRLTAAELRRIKMEPREDGLSSGADNSMVAISALLFENPTMSHLNRADGYSTFDDNSAPPPRGGLFEDEEDVNVETVETTEPVINGRTEDEQNALTNEAGVETETRPAFYADESEQVRRQGFKRKRQIADIRNLDAQTERMLAEAEKMRAEAQLIKMQAAEIAARLRSRYNGSAAVFDGQESNVEVNVVDNFAR